MNQAGLAKLWKNLEKNMTSLKSKILLSLIWVLFFSCQVSKREIETSSTVVKILKSDEKKELIVIEANTSRIIHECYFLNASDENKWRHHYFLYILNEKNEVISIMNPNNQSIDNCMRQFKKIKSGAFLCKRYS